MEKTVLHVGYPKTATTTLQYNSFESLYNHVVINYMGRFQNCSNSINKIMWDYVIEVRQNLDVEKVRSRFSRDKTSIIS
jgi:hypothetical protein